MLRRFTGIPNSWDPVCVPEHSGCNRSRKVSPTVQGPWGQRSLSGNYLYVRDHRTTDVESSCRASQQELKAPGVLGMGMYGWKSGGVWVHWVRLGSSDLYEEKEMSLTLHVH